MSCLAITAKSIVTINFKIVNFNQSNDKSQLTEGIVKIYPDINEHISIEAALKSSIFRWFKFTLKAPYSIAHDKVQMAI